MKKTTIKTKGQKDHGKKTMKIKTKFTFLNISYISVTLYI